MSDVHKWRLVGSLSRISHQTEIASVGTAMKQRDSERAEIERLTAEFLKTKKVTEVPYGKRSDVNWG